MKQQNMIIGEVSFQVSAEAVAALKAFLKKVSHTRSEYEEYGADVIIACRDLLLDKTNGGRDVVSAAMAREAVALLGDSGEVLDESSRLTIWRGRIVSGWFALLGAIAALLSIFLVYSGISQLLKGLGRMAYGDIVSNPSGASVWWPYILLGLLAMLTGFLAYACYRSVAHKPHRGAFRKLSLLLLGTAAVFLVFTIIKNYQIQHKTTTTYALDQSLIHTDRCGTSVQEIMIRPGHESDLFYETAAQGWQLISVLPISRGEASDKALFCPPYLALRKEHPMDKIVVMYVKKDSHSQVLPWIWHQDDESEELVGLYIKGN